MGTRKHHDVGFILIGVFKLVKGALLLALALSLIHRDTAEVIRYWAHVFQVDTDSKFVQYWLVEVGLVQQRDLALVVMTSLFYSALLSTEGVGLLMQKVWAEYLTSIITASFIPIEIYVLARHTSIARISLLLVNILVVAYLVFRLDQRKRPGTPTAS
jgi:uncharacterized membrane protein (DUF2068 family)